MQSSFMAKRELKEDDWERRPSIRSGPFSFLGSENLGKSSLKGKDT